MKNKETINFPLRIVIRRFDATRFAGVQNNEEFLKPSSDLTICLYLNFTA